MKKLFTFVFICLLMMHLNANAQCNGGTVGGSITPTAAWQSTNTAGIAGGSYRTFNAVSGNVYFFSFCTADGGNTIWDTQITIMDNFGNYAGGYNDDACGLASSLQWTAPSTATYRVLVNLYNCISNTNLGTMVYKMSPPLVCPTNLGTGVTNLTTLPYSSGAGTTCGMVNDLNATNTMACGNVNYLSGEDRVWIFTPSVTGSITITLTAPAASYTGLMLYSGCPLNGQGGTCVANSVSAAGSKTMNVCVNAGQQYFLILDSWASPACNAYNDLTISAPVPAGGCNLGTGLVNITWLPYTSINRTTCGKGNDLTQNNTVSCGSNLYLTGEDEVFEFTPVTSGNITINLTSSGSYTGMMLYAGCPLTSSCSGSAGVCVAFNQSSSGSKSMCVMVTAGVTYYLVIDSWANPSCNPYSISISSPFPAVPGATCATAISLASLPYSANNVSTSCTGNNYFNGMTGSCNTLYESGEDLVYSYVSSGSECIGITLSGASSNNIGFQIYSACPGSAGATCIGSFGGATSGTLSGSVILPSAGTYYIVIDSWAPPSSVTFNISVTSFGSGQVNDFPCNAQMLPLGVNFTGNNNCSSGSNEPPPPACWVNPNTVNSVWYRFIAPASGSVRIRTTPGTLLNTQIAAYAGTCGTSMILYGCNDNAPSCGTTLSYISELVLNSLTPGTIYYISVDGYNTQTGSFGIMVVDATIGYPYAAGQECMVPNPVCNSTISVGNPGYQAWGNYCDFPGGGGNCLLSGERGSAWYEIQINGNGFLEFDIIPNDWPGAPSTAGTDYDFAIWRTQTAGIPGPHSCSSIATGAVPLRCNYSFLGVTGCFSNAAGNAPASFPGFNAAYDSRLPVSNGDILILIVSNFSNSTSGFTMNFSAGSPINYTPSPGTIIWSGGIDDDWFKAPNWGGCAIPNCTTNVLISPSAANQPVIKANGAWCKSININAGASLTINAGFNLNVCGDFNNNGNFTTASTSSVTFNNGSVTQSILGNLIGANRFANVYINKTGNGIVSMSNDVDMSGLFTVQNVSSIYKVNGFTHRVGGNFSNLGVYDAGNGQLDFIGSVAQNYLNSGFLNRVLTNHTGPGVVLASNMNIGVNGSLNLNLGKIITNALEVNVTNSDTASVNTGNINSYVEGNLRRKLSGLPGAYNFPVGVSSKGYQLANVKFLSNTLISNLRAFFGVYTVVPPGLGLTECGVTYSNQALDNGFWDIAASNDPSSGNYEMTLFNRNYTNSGGSNGWTVMKNPNNAGWSLYNGTCVISPVTSVRRTGMNGFSRFGTAQAPLPLPVSLLNFEAKSVSDYIALLWSTASEKNNAGFEIERTTAYPDFYKIGFVSGAGNSNIINEYQFNDVNVKSGFKYYYRLKQIDYDGKFEYSPIVSAYINSDKLFSYNIMPNPYSGATNIVFYSDENAMVDIRVYNVTGELVSIITEGNLNKGQYLYQFSARDKGHPPGIYTLQIKVNDQLITERLVELN
ncbi:MAG TPA: T9SS type A sorting domain-containing protein [Bacteroidia bacterium]|nr:T9SS type A sorting domain-containing protein [Bacteroidia bacterium]